MGRADGRASTLCCCAVMSTAVMNMLYVVGCKVGCWKLEGGRAVADALRPTNTHFTPECPHQGCTFTACHNP